MRLRHLPGAILMAACALAPAATALAQGGENVQGDRYFRVEAEPRQTRRGPALAGYVYNSYGMTAQRVELLVEGLDASGNVVSSTIGYVSGTVPPFDRAYFEVRVPAGAASYRAKVRWWEWTARGGA